MVKKGTLKVCSNGHRFYKSSDCPSCPICESDSKPGEGFLSLLSSPARRALEHAGINTIQKLVGCRESEILKLHGMGPASIPILRKAVEDAGLEFKGERP